MILKLLQSEANKKAGYSTILIAELSANHGASLSVALDSISVAAKSGVDAIKIQTLQPDKITMDSDSPEFIVSGGLWSGKKLIELYEEAYTPWEWYPELKKKAEEYGIHIFSSPFDFEAVDYLVHHKVPAIKIASAEAMDVNFVEYCSSFGVPIILSTGMSTFDELKISRDIILKNGCDLTILHCVAEYPAEIDMMNISSITEMQNNLHSSIGLSDHSITSHASLAAVACGASVIEKHFSILPPEKTLDGEFSLSPKQLAEWVNEVRTFERLMGTPCIGIADSEVKNKKFRRSLYFTKDLDVGSKIELNQVSSIRPANGLHPKYLKKILGMKVNKKIKKGTPISWEDIE